MGLGKTISVACYLNALFFSERAQTVLLVLPKQLLAQWEAELLKWAPRLLKLVYHGDLRTRKENLAKIRTRGGILITTYGMVSTCADKLGVFEWTYTIADEAHKIKNKSTLVAREIRKIPSQYRVLLTGTPILNNLLELWSLFDFISNKESLLGTQSTFTTKYKNAIEQVRYSKKFSWLVMCGGSDP